MSLPVVLATTGAEALAVARERRPALVVLDVGLPDVSGFEVCRELRDQLGDHLPIILVSGVKTDEHDRVAGLLLGADDYFAKPLDTTLFKARVRRLVGRVAAAGEAASDGSRRFTPREQEVLRLLAGGHDRAAIARVLFISPRTVGSHIQHLLTKLGVHSQAQVVAAAYREGAHPAAVREPPARAMSDAMVWTKCSSPSCMRGRKPVGGPPSSSSRSAARISSAWFGGGSV
jgi:DNA-binding NarL/FixJ family response regulator